MKKEEWERKVRKEEERKAREAREAQEDLELSRILDKAKKENEGETKMTKGFDNKEALICKVQKEIEELKEKLAFKEDLLLTLRNLVISEKDKKGK